jgi:hypothetical protein
MQADAFLLTARKRRSTEPSMEGLHQFLEIVTKADNIPIVFMLFLVLFFTWVGLKQALRNDRLIEQGREEDVLKEMQR